MVYLPLFARSNNCPDVHLPIELCTEVCRTHSNMLWLLQNLNSCPKKFPEGQWAVLTEAPVVPCYPASRGSFLSASSWSATLALLHLLSFRMRSVCLQRKLDYFLHICMLVFISSVKNIFDLRKKELIKIGFLLLKCQPQLLITPWKALLFPCSAPPELQTVL